MAYRSQASELKWVEQFMDDMIIAVVQNRGIGRPGPRYRRYRGIEGLEGLEVFRRFESIARLQVAHCVACLENERVGVRRG